jgi:hypothetical protein
VRAALLVAGCLLAGCATEPRMGAAPAARVDMAPLEACTAETASLHARLAAETAERERATRAALRREDALRKQLEALKAIERGILEREDRVRTNNSR